MYDNFKNERNIWNGKVTPNELIDFLKGIKNPIEELIDDQECWNKNHNALNSGTYFEPSYRFGTTSERYKNEIKVHERMLSIKHFLSPPENLSQQIPPLQTSFFDPNYNLTMIERNEHCKALSWHTDNIPIYVAIRYGKQGIDWILDKFGQDVKEYYYEQENNQN